MNKIILIFLYIYNYIYNLLYLLFGHKYKIYTVGKYKIYKNYIKNLCILSEVKENSKILWIVERNYNIIKNRIIRVYTDIMDIYPVKLMLHIDSFSLYYIDSCGKLIRGNKRVIFDEFFRLYPNIDCIKIGENMIYRTDGDDTIYLFKID